MKPSEDNNLEKLIKETISLEEKKREVDHESRQIEKEIDKKEETMKRLLRQGIKLPEGSQYYAKLKYKARDIRGLPYRKFILQLPRKYSNAKKYLIKLKEEWLDKKVRYVDYGKKEE